MIRSAGIPMVSISSEALNSPSSVFGINSKARKSNECKTECDEHADFDSFKHTLSVACTIIIGNDWCNAVVKSKYRHEEKTL